MKPPRRPQASDVVHTYAGLTIAEAAKVRMHAVTLCGLNAEGRAMRIRSAFLVERRAARCSTCLERSPEVAALESMLDGVGR